MHIKIYRIAKDVEGNFRACKIKIDGKKYPRKFGAWYFTNSRITAKLLALKEQRENFSNALRGNLGVCHKTLRD
tara:strand:- start:241 stop:462 length:222 start_codon:yes stop_codon:yes gene_type:complete